MAWGGITTPGRRERMEEVTVAGQPTEYLESMLDCLACPLDNSVALSAVRDGAGEIVALKSRDAEYRVVHNVPCLLPGSHPDGVGALRVP
jgi:uncharacterized protein YbaR (Trm112 family)